MLRVTLINAIFSYNLATPVIAELDGAAVFNDRTVLPDKTKLLGRALILKSHDRVNIDFSLAVLPDGREIPLAGIGLSPDGSAGIKGKVEQHKDSLVASAALKGAISGTAAIAAQAADPITVSASQSAAQETVRAIDLSNERIDTSIWIPAFTRCLVYLDRKLEIAPIEKEGKSESNKKS